MQKRAKNEEDEKIKKKGIYICSARADSNKKRKKEKNKTERIQKWIKWIKKSKSDIMKCAE